ncbi:NAD(P)-binding domain-containing protein [Granulicella cerasi]|uniref:NAD(P)-binding domain-containing protein n=1 Tax=Granulicella cerasi TaxID=741063 RepID=A0ABW1ZCA1_9BACT|nr:NAD(P)/FAD-dependent oxidoreductase [Granulicella cerasi]
MTSVENGLLLLEERLRSDLRALNYPPENWTPERETAHGAAISDVVIIGGGMCGLAAAFALKRKGIHRLRIFDSSPAGKEGPWVTFARMRTLRSPKNLTGPAGDLPALTFRAWYEAKFGDAAWEALDKIPRETWMEYLCWYREVLQLPVENECTVERVEPSEDGVLRVRVRRGEATFDVFARKVVMATGRSGQGAPVIPAWGESLPRAVWTHSSDMVDFDGLKGKRVVVIGAGASAMDNAAEALEHGAAEVRLLVRRSALPAINKLMGIGSFGFTHGFPALPDEWRWRIMHYSQRTQTPPPRASVMRVSQHGNASLHLGTSVMGVRLIEDGAIGLLTNKGDEIVTDHVIFGTGFSVRMREDDGVLAGAENVLLWRDRYTPPAGLEDEELSISPYINSSFQFAEREAGATPWVKQVHCFNHAATLSLGKVSGDIPRVSEGAAWLAAGVAEGFYVEDIEQHWKALQEYSTPELLGDEWRSE